MGQCSTLPAEGRTAASKRGDDSSTFRNKEKFGQKSPRHDQKHNYSDVTTPQSRNPEAQFSEGPQPMDEDSGREGIPLPPEIATRTRCFRLNLDSAINHKNAVFLGPFAESPPPLTYSSSEDSAVHSNPVQIAIQTAKIFRGISVSKDGTILAQNARATRSNRGAKNKRGEKSRQATKIDKAKDLVEESILTGKAPDSDEPANMQSLVVMGEYDDMKYLVKDGARKLRDASELPDDTLLSSNRGRKTDFEGPGMLSPRKRGMSPNYGGNPRPDVPQNPGKHRSVNNNQAPRIKAHPRDYSSSRKGSTDPSTKSDSHGENVGGGVGGGDWSNTLNFSRGFHSIWNCGGTGEDTGTISPSQGPKDARQTGVAMPASPFRPVFEGRDARDSSYGQARESGVTSRAN